ncbi:hypothetical protein C9374_005535 [Naegleria lovaniensis]|uniref:Uncharacterized protein n=1 Tax=Naegleria lovaniensis TaxID=51637 RepID=A0AA88GQJ6_NAELO|nr:uncharacterized protein C9374_005535 [Naegleria lovaniensis]KAG2382333.1 hypothetical protein C9374_005535 [Naegleria lovaniensis]
MVKSSMDSALSMGPNSMGSSSPNQDFSINPAVEQLSDWKNRFNDRLQEVQEEMILFLTNGQPSNEEMTSMIKNTFSDLKISISELLSTLTLILKKFLKKSKKLVQTADGQWEVIVLDLNNQLEHVSRARAVEEEKRRELEKEVKLLRQKVKSMKIEMTKPKDDQQYQQLVENIKANHGSPNVNKTKPTVTTPKQSPRTPRSPNTKTTPTTPKSSKRKPVTPKSEVKTEPRVEEQAKIEEPKPEPVVEATKEEESKPSVEEQAPTSNEAQEEASQVANAGNTEQIQSVVETPKAEEEESKEAKKKSDDENSDEEDEKESGRRDRRSSRRKKKDEESEEEDAEEKSSRRDRRSRRKKDQEEEEEEQEEKEERSSRRSSRREGRKKKDDEEEEAEEEEKSERKSSRRDRMRRNRRDE